MGVTALDAREVRAPSHLLPQFELTGPDDAPVVVVLGGISATRHVCANDADPSPGWWNSVVGAGRAIDTTRYRVLSLDYLDGGCGPDGRPLRTITTRDQGDGLARVLDALGIDRVRCIVGASYGGMVALAFGALHPGRAERLVVISSPHESHPMSTALRLVQREIVELGLESGHVHEAMSIARRLAMTTYRSAREFAERFSTQPEAGPAGELTFPVGRYLAHHGDRFADAFSPERFLALSLSSDLHRVEPESITTPTLVVAAEGDTLVPAEQLRGLCERLGGPARLAHLRSRCGHDAFLTEPTNVGRLITVALSGSIFA